MSDWRIRQLYGSGAGRVRLCPTPRAISATPSASLREAMALLGDEIHAQGYGAALSNTGRFVPGMLLGLAMIAALIITVGRETVDSTDLRIVHFEMARELPRAPEPQPAPEPVAKPLPEPVVAQLPPPPPRPEPKVVEKPPPPPKPKPPVAKKPRVAPPPPVKMAAVRLPPPAAAPPRPDRPEPVARPKPNLRIDALAPEAAKPAPAPAPTRAARPDRRTRAVPRPALGLAPVAPAPEFAPATSNRGRSAPPSRSRPAPAARPRPSVSPLSAPAAPGPADPLPSQARATREAPARASRTARPGVLAMAAAPTTARPVVAAPSPAERVERRAPSGPRREPRRDDDALKGVALGSLAACMSDREEDELKLEVVSATSGRSHCASRAGRYRFVETKNLNAFLMWIERAPSRKQADRCVELRLALECLRGAGRQGGDRR